jgi:hypothetical protein
MIFSEDRFPLFRIMRRFKLFSAALILSAGMTSPVFAQAAIQEPGAYAFYHPDGDLLHANSPRPSPDAMAMAVPGYGGGVLRHHTRTHRAAARHHDRSYLR